MKTGSRQAARSGSSAFPSFNARLQTCDRGRPVALYTVARELGHRGTAMIEDRYGHLHDRAGSGSPEVVEYRVEHHIETLGERLTALERPAAARGGRARA